MIFNFMKKLFGKKEQTPSKQIEYNMGSSSDLSGSGISFYPTATGVALPSGFSGKFVDFHTDGGNSIPIVDVQDLKNNAVDPYAVLDIIQQQRDGEIMDSNAIINRESVGASGICIPPGVHSSPSSMGIAFSGVVGSLPPTWNFVKGSGCP